ncbi:MAG: flagellar hook-basal body complex protein, partial [Synergistaceae bacterium]|nr:flagellar hook-basal body complex protein [Synergistaceae bacterium]
ESNLVQAGTGYRLQGYQMVRDPIDPLQFNQGSSLTDVNIPTGQKMEARQTTVVGYRCNLDSRAGTYLPMGLTSNNFSTTASLNNQKYEVTMQEGATADEFMTMTIGDQTLTLKLAGVDESNGRPMLASEEPFEIDGSVYTVAFDSATGILTLTNIDPTNPDEWTLNLEEQMDYQTFTIADGANRYSYLAEFTDITTAGQEGYKTLRLWGEDYKGEMAMFEYTVQMNDDGTFAVPDAEIDGITRLGGFAGGAFVSIGNATGNQGVELTSTVEIVDASQVTDKVGIKPTIVQNVGIGGKAYDVTITEGNPNSGYVTLKFVDRADPNNTGTLQLNYDGLNSSGAVELTPASTFVLDGKTYEAEYTSGVTDALGSLALNDITDPLVPITDVWTYALGSKIKMGFQDISSTGGPLQSTFGDILKTEFDSLGSGDYRMTILGEDPTDVLEVQTFNFRKNMGVVPVTSNVMVGSTEYAVTPLEGTTSGNFMTLSFDDGSGSPVTANFQMTSVVDGRLNFTASAPGTIALGTQTYDITTVPYDPATGILTFTNTTPGGQNFTYEVGKYVNFQTVTDGNGATYVVDFDESGSGAFTMKVWAPAAAGGTPNTFSVPVTKGNEQSLATINQRIANVHNTKIDIYDSLGNPYTLEVSWEKVDNGVWRWRAWLPNGEATIAENTGLIRFGPDGKLDTSDTGMFNATPEITLQFDEKGARESTVKLDFSGQSFQKELLDGVTQYGSEFTTKGYYQDGYSMGVLTDFAVAQDGTVNGIYSNGQNIPLYRVALALFANPAGLVKNGNTAFTESNNSGIAQIGSPQEGGAGSIVGSSLEMSNVDLTEEFTRLIVSQRGFQANARMITTSDQVLEELINIKR